MQPELSVHDNFVYAYAVDCECRRITLRTVYRDREPFEYTDVVFHDVLAHRFESALPGNILFAIEEVEVEALVRENAALFQASWRYGWPPVDYRGDLPTLHRELKERAVRAYQIAPSYGLCGWVLAGGCTRQSALHNASVRGAA